MKKLTYIHWYAIKSFNVKFFRQLSKVCFFVIFFIGLLSIFNLVLLEVGRFDLLFSLENIDAGVMNLVMAAQTTKEVRPLAINLTNNSSAHIFRDYWAAPNDANYTYLTGNCPD